jgi:hypothetical protein
MCIPDVEAPGMVSCASDVCPTNAPICLFSVCLTVDQLACVCLNPVGQGLAYQCAAARADTDASAGACLTQDSLCDGNPGGCCHGLSCVRGKDAQGKPMLGLCEPSCENDSECPESCCTEAQGVAGPYCTNYWVCANSCRREDEACYTGRDRCCGGLECVQGNAVSELNGCKVPCIENGNCKSGCCKFSTDPDGGTARHGVCAPSTYCH